MIILAEIADKMPSIPWMWLSLGIIGTILAAIGLIHRFLAYSVFLIGLLISIVFVYLSYYDAFVDPTFRDAVHTEMGTIWIVNSLTSVLCPALFTFLVFLFHYKRRKKQTNALIQNMSFLKNKKVSHSI
jgi:hypothetical protein